MIINYQSKIIDSDIFYQIVTDTDKIKESWNLVYENYLELGLINPNFKKIHLPLHYMQSKIAILSCFTKGHIVSTVSIFVSDKGEKIPLDTMYHKEVENIRKQNRKIMEVGLLAEKKTLKKHTQFLETMKYVFHYSQHMKIDDMLIGVNPKHINFYNKVLGFFPIGKVKKYFHVNNNDVMLMRMNIEKIIYDKNKYPTINSFLSHPIKKEMFVPPFSFKSDSILL